MQARRLIRLLCLAQPRLSHIVFTVEELKLRIFLRDHAGKFAVDHGVGAVDGGIRLFKAHIVIQLVHPRAHGKRNDLAGIDQHETIHVRRFKMVERTGNCRFFLLNLLVPLVDLVPFAHHIAAALQILRRDDFRFEIRMVLLEAVAVVALGLQLLSVKLGKLLDGINVVIGVSVSRKGEFSGVERFQKRFPVVRHAAQANFSPRCFASC